MQTLGRTIVQRAKLLVELFLHFPDSRLALLLRLFDLVLDVLSKSGKPQPPAIFHRHSHVRARQDVEQAGHAQGAGKTARSMQRKAKRQKQHTTAQTHSPQLPIIPQSATLPERQWFVERSEFCRGPVVSRAQVDLLRAR